MRMLKSDNNNPIMFLLLLVLLYIYNYTTNYKSQTKWVSRAYGVCYYPRAVGSLWTVCRTKRWPLTPVSGWSNSSRPIGIPSRGKSPPPLISLVSFVEFVVCSIIILGPFLSLMVWRRKSNDGNCGNGRSPDKNF